MLPSSVHAEDILSWQLWELVNASILDALVSMWQLQTEQMIKWLDYVC